MEIILMVFQLLVGALFFWIMKRKLQGKYPIYYFLLAITVSSMCLTALASFVATRNGWVTRPSLFYKPSISTALDYFIGAVIWAMLAAIFYYVHRHNQP
jgi:hypothetical protein